MSSTEPLCIDTASPPQNGDQPNDTVSEKPVEEPAAVAAGATTAAAVDLAKSAPIDDILPEQDDKLDEFARLELELAELNKSASSMHEDLENDKLSNIVTSECVGGKTNVQDEDSKSNLESEMQLIEKDLLLNVDTTASSQNGQRNEATSEFLHTNNDLAGDIFDHEDLIAVLKGESTDEPAPNNTNDATNNPMETELPSSSKASIEHLAPAAENFEGVTIEGEGEYQIMEVVDDFEDELEANVIATSQPLGAATSKSTPTQKLTREEERAVAMEQIAGLKRPPRRRKQDIKPLPFETSELVSTLGADWSDDGDEAELANVSAIGAKATQNTNLKKENASEIDAQLARPTSAADDSSEAKAAVTAKAGARKRRRSTGANVTSVIVLPSQPESAAGDRAAVESPITAATGFKRTRTIKRRIIWDPDAPETAISYADLVRSKSKDRQSSMSPSIAQKSRSATPKEKPLALEAMTSADKKPMKRATTPSTKSAALVKDKADSHEIKSTGKQALRRSQTVSPVANGGSATAAAAAAHAEPRKKKISEIDRLMGDEGAASMLSSLESGRGKLADESDEDKPHRPLMRSRTGPAEKANKRETTWAAASAPSSPPAKKARAPKAKPSASWDYVYQKSKQHVSDDSMIIRRRSNSSYSSNASQHRLSIDGPISAAPSKTKSKSIKSDNSDDESADNDTTNANQPTEQRTTKQTVKTTAKSTAAKDNSSSPPGSVKSSGYSGNKRASPVGENSKTFEFLKPKETKKNAAKTPNRRSTIGNEESTLKADIKKTTPKRGRPAMANKQKESPQSSTSTPATTTANTFGSTAAADADTNVVVRKTAKIAQVIFSTDASKISGTFTPELMNQIVDALDTLAHDANCNVVVLLTNGPDFCRGLDLSNLAAGGVEHRKTAAVSLATSAKNLLKTFATFPKPLVTGINGSVVGLGVTLLPLFDVVIASDKVTLETPYAKIGQVPEGFCIWQNLWNIRTTAKTKLFWLAEKLISTEAASAGLVTKLTTADKVNDDAIAAAKKMSYMSIDAYRYMKKTTIQSRLEVVISAIDDEFEEIIKQWTTAECCAKIKKYIESGGHFTVLPKQN